MLNIVVKFNTIPYLKRTGENIPAGPIRQFGIRSGDFNRKTIDRDKDAEKVRDCRQ